LPFNDRLLRALNRQPVDRTPVWFMRQAGRSLPRYRELRADQAFFDLLADPEAAASISALPLEYFPVDAAVVYNDLVTPFLGAGFKLELVKGIGPVVDRPIRTAEDVRSLKPFDPKRALAPNLETIRLLEQRLDVPVVGFVGAPFTLCSYLLAGPRSRDLHELKSFILREPQAWDYLASYWADHLAEYAIRQHEAGAAAIQVFDSWAGALSVEDYRRHVLPYSWRLLDRLARARVLTIHYFGGNPALLESVAEAGGDCISVDWRIPLDQAWERIGHHLAIQGNLDPAALLAGPEAAITRTREVLTRAAGRPGHVFNLGHGILPETDHEVLAAVVQAVHDFSAERQGTYQETTPQRSSARS
jgi:uroporphyrinogen decarboxylase